MNYVIFQNKKSKPADIINQGTNIFQDTPFYMRGTNMFYQELSTGGNNQNPRSRAVTNY